MKYIYGPVQSRRLGLSLGITLTAYKTCSFDCVYCQLGKTRQLTTETKEYLPIQEILEEVKAWLQNNPQEAQNLSYITFSGSGEPTLNSRMGELITGIKKLTAVKVAVITNASLLKDPQVLNALLGADLVVPSLDAATAEILEKIDRPHASVRIADIIEGLINLRKEFKGQIWLEVMLVKGLNDDLRQIKKLKEAIDKIKPDKIQLNSPVRTTSEPGIIPADKEKLKKAALIFGDKCEIF